MSWDTDTDKRIAELERQNAALRKAGENLFSALKALYYFGIERPEVQELIADAQVEWARLTDPAK